MATPNSRQEAQALIWQIAEDHGYIAEEELQTVKLETRRRLKKALINLGELAGLTIITLAKNLYTSKARFVFELLQNADDNRYSQAASTGSVPYISFHVYPSRIVVECNEDGFTSENLTAICSVGRSSKIGAQGYIGEKGIGFKSVFMVAWKVHIQSGAFSFSFSHRTGDSGLGMISPVWEDTSDELQPPLTKMTLFLHETGGPGALQRAPQAIMEQFEELQETFLLFMKNLGRVHVAFCDENGEQTSSTTYTVERPQNNHAVTKRVEVSGDTTRERVRHFHVTTYEATNLAKNENRTYSQAEEATRAYSTSPVTLAFPLSEGSVPIIEPQKLFAFLPVRPVGFTFLIQADFVTEASRQDIVKDSPRNNGLLDGVANAFIKAVLQFCEHGTLRYQWMRYLPRKEACKNWSPPWSSLADKISNGLSRTAVLYGRKRPDRRLIRDLFYPTTGVLDVNGEPLFDDGDPGQLISQLYASSDLDILQEYGLHLTTFSHVLSWLKNDLAQDSVPGGQSRMRSPASSESWHTRVATLLRAGLARKLDYFTHGIQALDILPLEDGNWASASPCAAYFPKVDGLDIPPGTGLQLISRAVTNTERIALFRDLGVKTASVDFVRGLLLSRSHLNTNLEISNRQLRFLYLTEHVQGSNLNYSMLPVFSGGTLTFTFFPTYIVSYLVARGEPYGAFELLRKTEPGPNLGDGAEGHLVWFVNEAYFEDSPATPKDQNLGWREWFYVRLGVQKCAVVTEGQALSKAGEYLRQHRSEKFLGALRLWHQHSGGFSPQLISCLQGTEVLCRGNRKAVLNKAYFPTRNLEERVERFVEPGAYFPWLWLDNTDATCEAMPQEWATFLGCLKVGTPASDLDFALDMLKYSVDGIHGTVTWKTRAKLSELYHHIQETSRESQNRQAARDLIRGVFDHTKRIYVICSAGKYHTWALRNQCVWSAPQEMRTKYVLQLFYGPDKFPEISHSLCLFFTETLGVRAECTWDMYVAELKDLKASGCNDSGTITGIYKALDSLRSTIIGISKDEIIAAFQNDALIYVSSDAGPAWHATSGCVWSTAARLRGRVSLNNDYGDLRELFVDFLGVKPVNLTMAIEELKEEGGRTSTSIAEMKESIRAVNSLLSTETRPRSWRDVAESCIFPIRHPDGEVVRGSRAVEFFVVDREPLRRCFEGRVKLLDFSLDEVAQLRPFIEWLHLDDRYLSRCVKEVTSTAGGGERLVTSPDRQIRNRAHALLRVAVHFNSPRVRAQGALDAFYGTLRNAKIYETDSICLGLHLSQDGASHVVESEKVTLHIHEEGEEDSSVLKVYLPRDRNDQAYAFATQLSHKLLRWMMSDPDTNIAEEVGGDAAMVVNDVLLAPRARLSMALEDRGIATIDVENVDEDEDVDEDEGVDEDGPVEAEVTATNTREVDRASEAETDQSITWIGTPSSTLSGREGSGSSDGVVVVASAPNRANRANIMPWRPSHGPHNEPGSPLPPSLDAPDININGGYVALLNRVIDAAARGVFPGVFGMSELEANLPRFADQVDLGLRSDSRVERDCKVGAAGELYVFELLSHLSPPNGLPGFSRDNWQSTIRRYVTTHPRYADMAPWLGRETSDITYPDSEGALTALFVDKGYLLPREAWAGRTPRYFIEVKTTTSACETPFYMSRAQYERMQSHVLDPGKHDAVYVIFRVYNLGRDDMGLRVYLDPETLKRSGQIEFTAETWSVVPRSGVPV